MRISQHEISHRSRRCILQTFRKKWGALSDEVDLLAESSLTFSK